MFIQQDGAQLRHHQDILKEEFPNRWISFLGPVTLSARSQDITPIDFFFYDVIWKNRLYSRYNKNVEDLRQADKQNKKSSETLLLIYFRWAFLVFNLDLYTDVDLK